ncbi:MAG: polysaccharide deacetylase family protein [Pseudomonadota bacterium]
MTRYRKLPRVTAKLIRAAGDAIARRAGEGRLCIVNYHRILDRPDPLLDSEPDLETFRWQVGLLADCFNVLPLGEAVRALAAGTLPPRAVAITFDDGYRSTHDLALPILQEFALPATVFVTTGHIENDSSMWNDIILEAVRRLPHSVIDLHDLGLGEYPMHSAEDRKNTADALTEKCKYLAPEERQVLTNRLQSMTRDDLQQELMLTPAMIRTLAQTQVEIGGHTVSHPILTRIDDEAARYEIVENKRQLEAITGQPVTLFAYPNGKYGIDFDQRHVQMAGQAGYQAAFTTAIGSATRRDDLFKIPRSRPWDASRLMFAARLLKWLAGRTE